MLVDFVLNSIPLSVLFPRAGSFQTGSMVRGVASRGSASEWGSEGREFKSHRPDHFSSL